MRRSIAAVTIVPALAWTLVACSDTADVCEGSSISVAPLTLPVAQVSEDNVHEVGNAALRAEVFDSDGRPWTGVTVGFSFGSAPAIQQRARTNDDGVAVARLADLSFVALDEATVWGRYRARVEMELCSGPISESAPITFATPPAPQT